MILVVLVNAAGACVYAHKRVSEAEHDTSSALGAPPPLCLPSVVVVAVISVTCWVDRIAIVIRIKLSVRSNVTMDVPL